MKLTVPERLSEAANRLKDNKTIYCGLDDDMKKVVRLAAEQKVLQVYLSDGCKSKSGHYAGGMQEIAYCLPDDTEIVSEPEQTWWQKEGLILCEIKKQNVSTGWYLDYPNGNTYQTETLGVPRYDDYGFVGFVHNGKLEKWSDIKNVALGYLDKDGSFWSVMQESYTPSTATHTVWRKKEVK